MKHNGMNFVRNGNFGFRMSDPSKDFDLRGDPVEKNYVSFVRIRDCEIIESHGKSYYDTDGAPSIPVNHGGTYYGYGEWKKRKSTAGTYVERQWVNEYWQCTVYLANDGRVYTSSIKRIEKP